MEKVYKEFCLKKAKFEAVTTIAKKLNRELQLLELQEVLDLFDSQYDVFNDTFIRNELKSLNIEPDPFLVNAITIYKRGGDSKKEVLRLFDTIQDSSVGKKMNAFISYQMYKS